MAGWQQGDGQAAPVGLVPVAFDQAAFFQGGDHVGHGLGGDERVAGELRDGHVGVAFEYGQRRVLQGGQPVGPEQVVQVRPDGELDLLDEVHQHRLAAAAAGADVRVRAPRG